METCHGQHNCLQQGSQPLIFLGLHKVLSRIRAAYIHLLWHLNNKGLAGTLKLVASKVSKIVGVSEHRNLTSAADGSVAEYEEVLNLKPGDWVEVKSEDEIYATLDSNRRNKGLLWMVNMRIFCGKRYRVFKRVSTILLECDGQVRKLKNTVLLEGVYCDGIEFNGCDRSCPHFWREAWLKRVDKTN
jgi:hypothetical protein